MNSEPLLAGIEAGGTKFICALASREGSVIREARIETASPDQTFRQVQEFYAEAPRYGRIVGTGVASFGPLDLNKTSAGFGTITSTPKRGWQGVNIRDVLSQITSSPVDIDTDVTCAALAEAIYGAARDLEHVCYMTVGTGIGVGVISAGGPLPGAGHAEIGHMRLPRVRGDEGFEGICPYHGDCAEGLASGPAMEARWGTRAENLPDDHPAWEIEARYIAMLCANLTYAVRPERIVIGGGVFSRSILYDLVRQAYRETTAGYALSAIEGDTDTYICAPGCTDQPPGLIGALELAKQAASRNLQRA